MTISKSEFELILRQDLMTFIARVFAELHPDTELLPAPYLEVMATYLEKCRRGEIPRLIINIPPRYLKSVCVTIAFCAWVLGHDPTKQIICASYGQELADKFARDTRRIMLSKWYQDLFATRLTKGQQLIHDFATTKQGFRMATSVGGILTGRGADLIIIDDPLKPTDAMSETARNAANEWFTNTLLSRLNDKKTGCIILVMQRLHQDDMTGFLLEMGGWELLSFPAIAEQDESFAIESPLGNSCFVRRAGEALHPERESLADLQKIAQTMGTATYSAQYLQNPLPPGGAIIKHAWLQSYNDATLPAQFDQVVQSWDTANKAGELNDYSVCTTWGIKNKRCYLLDVLRQRLTFPELKRAVKAQAAIYNPDVILIEDKASGTQLIQDLHAEGMHGVQACEPAGMDKIMRLHSHAATFESGMMFLPEKASWLAEYIKELTGFPGTKHDDQVDSTTQFLSWVKKILPGQGVFDYYKAECERMGLL